MVKETDIDLGDAMDDHAEAKDRADSLKKEIQAAWKEPSAVVVEDPAFRDLVANMRRFQKVYEETGNAGIKVKKETTEAQVDALLE